MALSHTPIPHDPGYENSHSFRPHTDPLARYINMYIIIINNNSITILPPKDVIVISSCIVVPIKLIEEMEGFDRKLLT